MPKRKFKIIIDTNLWISFLLNRDFSRLDKLLLKDEVTLIFSQELLDEFLRVVHRPKFKKYFLKTDIDTVITRIEQNAHFIDVTTIVNICRDAKDNFLLSMAIDGEADFLLTGDKDLLELKAIEKTRIISISEYLK